jgi:hypothetical protein
MLFMLFCYSSPVLTATNLIVYFPEGFWEFLHPKVSCILFPKDYSVAAEVLLL